MGASGPGGFTLHFWAARDPTTCHQFALVPDSAIGEDGCGSPGAGRCCNGDACGPQRAPIALARQGSFQFSCLPAVSQELPLDLSGAEDRRQRMAGGWQGRTTSCGLKIVRTTVQLGLGRSWCRLEAADCLVPSSPLTRISTQASGPCCCDVPGSHCQGARDPARA